MWSEDTGLREPAVAYVKEQGGAVVVGLRGELDLHNSEDVRAGIESAGGSPPGRIVVDLADVEFVDSTTIAVLVQANRAAGKGHFRLAAPSPEVRRALGTAGVDRYFDVYDRVDEALGA
jgi:anti-sigma B factor antagonist